MINFTALEGLVVLQNGTKTDQANLDSEVEH